MVLRLRIAGFVQQLNMDGRMYTPLLKALAASQPTLDVAAAGSSTPITRCLRIACRSQASLARRRTVAV